MKGDDVLLKIPARVISIRAEKLAALQLSYTKAVWADQRKPANQRRKEDARKARDRALIEAGKTLFGIEVPFDRLLGLDWKALERIWFALEEAGIDFRAPSYEWASARAAERRKAVNARRRARRTRKVS